VSVSETFGNDLKLIVPSALEARFSDGSSLTGTQTRAHVTLLIQAGADTTATALGSILRFLTTDPSALARARAEIAVAEEDKLLSTPVKYEETRRHLPFFCACIREGLRLHPPAVNLFARVVPKGGKVIDGHFVPAGTNVTSHGYVVQRDPATYSSDAEVFRPERWMTDEKRVYELEAAQFTFGVGSRGCLGKDVAYMEMYKLLPEVSLSLNLKLRPR
jgi:cytochrome P450